MITIKEVVERLIDNNKTIATMESCTGGGVSNSITNIPDSSKVLEFSAVTYSNSYKIKMGVSKEIIEKYTVYSMEVACEMSKSISKFANSSYGVGVTGKFNRTDINNLTGDDSTVYISIYDRDNDKFVNKQIKVSLKTREENKEEVISTIKDMLLSICK